MSNLHDDIKYLNPKYFTYRFSETKQFVVGTKTIQIFDSK